MKISLLLNREPFPEILVETMERYFSVVECMPYRVEWRERSLFERITFQTQAQEWLCNPLINAIFAASARSEVLELPRRWYGTGPTLARTATQRAYVFAATSPIMRRALAGPAILIDPMPANPCSLLITGGNTRLRLFNFDKGEATTILKSRFDESFITADLAVRTAHPWLPAPPVLDVLDDGRAYKEPILSLSTAGKGLTAVARHHALAQAVGACERLSLETSERTYLKDYANRLLGQCQDIATVLGTRNPGIKAPIDSSIAKIRAAAEAVIDDRKSQMWIGQSHGDLAPGNILADADAFYLIDWERTAKRMRGFDAITLALAARRCPTGLLNRARRLIAAAGDFGPAAVAAREALTGQSSKQTHARLLIYLAEELLFHLEENHPAPIAPPTLALARLLAELQSDGLFPEVEGN